MAIIMILAIPTQLGLPSLLLKFVSKYEAEKKWEKLKGVITFSNIIVFAISLLTIITGVVFVRIGGFANEIEKVNTFYWGLVLLPVIALGALRSAALRGLQYVIRGLAPERVIRTAFLCLFLVLYYFLFAENLDASRAMMLHFGAATVAFIIGTWWLYKKCQAKSKI